MYMIYHETVKSRVVIDSRLRVVNGELVYCGMAKPLGYVVDISPKADAVDPEQLSLQDPVASILAKIIELHTV